MFFVIPEMPSKTFVMLYKKLPDHFKLTFSTAFALPMLGDILTGYDEPSVSITKDDLNTREWKLWY